MPSESGEVEDKVRVDGRIPEPRHLDNPDRLTKIKRFFDEVFFGQDHRPYTRWGQKIRARDALYAGIPFDVTKSNYFTCEHRYDRIQECADEKGVSLWGKKRCDKWEKLYLVSCIDPPKKQGAGSGFQLENENKSD